ncbi:MAG: type II CAAX endopeptidase family protein [Lachnospiraceae bacterium]|jgi:membrane protease YdiL (CAAX protease family)|nr:type II CAAX endopeptidase family protein [Lachnospiraceae bacterium]
MIYKIGNVFVPLLIHYLIAAFVLLFGANFMDDALLTSLTALVALPVMWYLYRRDRRNGAVETTALRGTVPWWAFLVTILLGIVSNQMITGVMNYFRVTQQFSNEVQEGLLRGDIWAQVLGLGILVPVMEEILFRGLIYNRLKKYVSLWTAILGGAVIFALYHGNMVQFLFALPMGLLIILLYERWHSLSIPIVFHIAANLSTVLLNCLVLK